MSFLRKVELKRQLQALGIKVEGNYVRKKEVEARYRIEGKTWYHATSQENLPSIRKKGLIPKAFEENLPESKLIFFTSDLEEAKLIASSYDEHGIILCWEGPNRGNEGENHVWYVTDKVIPFSKLKVKKPSEI